MVPLKDDERNRKIEVTSVGKAGEIEERSADRTYLTIDERVTSLFQLKRAWTEVRMAAQVGEKRRWMVKAVCSPDVAAEAVNELPVEVCVPLSYINQDDDHYMLVIAENDYACPIPEFPLVADERGMINDLRATPLERTTDLPYGFSFSHVLEPEDTARLAELWQTFGWTPQGVEDFIYAYNQASGVWFSGIRDDRDGELASVAIAESLDFAGITLVEGTEYSTLQRYAGAGLSSATVARLHAQVLKDTLYTVGKVPLISAEYNLKSRADLVGKKVGMIVPDYAAGSGFRPTQILKQNVAVFDGKEPEKIRWRRSKNAAHDAFLRNFVMGVLPEENIRRYYSQGDVESMLSL